MRLIALTIAAAMLTIEQRDGRSIFDPPSVSVSADGRYVAFTTYAQLASADADALADVYVLDRARNVVTLESEEQPTVRADAFGPDISGDGRLLVYQSDDAVVVRDRTAQRRLWRVHGRQPAISANGVLAVFSAARSASAPGPDINGAASDIYTLDIRSGGLERISLDLPGLDNSLAASVSPAVSADARLVAFSARLPIAQGRALTPALFLRDLQTLRTIRLGDGWSPSLSADGRYVAFVAAPRKTAEVFLLDRQTGARAAVTRTPNGGPPNGDSAYPSISAEGRFVAFQSDASNLTRDADVNLLYDVFLFDSAAGTTSRISGDAEEAWMEPSGGPSIDALGSLVAFSSRHPTGAADKRNDFDLYVATLKR